MNALFDEPKQFIGVPTKVKKDNSNLFISGDTCMSI